MLCLVQIWGVVIVEGESNIRVSPRGVIETHRYEVVPGDALKEDGMSCVSRSHGSLDAVIHGLKIETV